MLQELLERAVEICKTVEYDDTDDLRVPADALIARQMAVEEMLLTDEDALTLVNEILSSGRFASISWKSEGTGTQFHSLVSYVLMQPHPQFDEFIIERVQDYEALVALRKRPIATD